MKHEKLTEMIIGCAYRVYNKMGFGFLESVYENCLMIELRKAELSAKAQQGLTVYYDKVIVGEFIADIIVEDLVVIELKSVREISPMHEVQLVNYLTATGKDIGLLINFGQKGVQVKRKVRELGAHF